MDLLNKVMLAGNLARDPDVRSTGSGKKVAEFTLALDPPGAKRRAEPASPQPGGRNSAQPVQDGTIFVDVVFWDRAAENAGEYLRKGSGVLVEGRLRMDSWEDRETGKIRRKLKVNGERMRFLNLASNTASQNEAGRREGARS